MYSFNVYPEYQISSISSSRSSSRPNGGNSPTSTFSGLTKTPLLPKHTKYRCPPTLPSFFPIGSSSSIPTQIGWRSAGSSASRCSSRPGPVIGIVGTRPTKRIVPRRICGGDEGRTIARLATAMSTRMRLVHRNTWTLELFFQRTSPLNFSLVFLNLMAQSLFGR